MKLIKSACFIALLFLSACSVPQYVQVPVDYTAKQYLRRDSSTIVLINQFAVDPAKIPNKKTFGVVKAGAYAAIDYAGFELSQLKHVKIINLVDSTTLAVNTDSIKLIAQKYNANYVLALKGFAANINLAEFGQYTNYYNTNTSVNFMLYESNGLYFRKLNGTAIDQQSEQPNFGLLATLIVHPTVKGNKQSIKSAAEHATEDALKDYFPYSITHTRPLYNDDYLQPANRQILIGKLDRADTLLQRFLEDKNIDVACKAAYNLAVVYEYEGDIAGALDMATQSNEKRKNQFAEMLIADLKQE
jgi:hypothetical protein